MTRCRENGVTYVMYSFLYAARVHLAYSRVQDYNKTVNSYPFEADLIVSKHWPSISFCLALRNCAHITYECDIFSLNIRSPLRRLSPSLLGLSLMVSFYFIKQNPLLVVVFELVSTAVKGSRYRPEKPRVHYLKISIVQI